MVPEDYGGGDEPRINNGRERYDEIPPPITVGACPFDIAAIGSSWYVGNGAYLDPDAQSSILKHLVDKQVRTPER